MPDPDFRPVIALRGDARYRRYLDTLLRRLKARGHRVDGHTYHQLAEFALVHLGMHLGVKAPPRGAPHGGKRTPVDSV